MMRYEKCYKQYTASFMNKLAVTKSTEKTEELLREWSASNTPDEDDSVNHSLTTDHYIRSLILGAIPVYPIPENCGNELEFYGYKYLLLLRLGPSVQAHSSKHHSSCSKSSQRAVLKNKCRFGMPADVCLAAHLVTVSGIIELQRSSTNIYVNAFNTALLFALKLIDDFRLLLGTGGSIFLYYVFKYIMKSQSRIDHLPIVFLDLGNLMVKDAIQEVPIERRAIIPRGLSSIGRAMASDQETGVGMAACYL